jgi:preprotein translocase subunit YajC
MKKLTIATLLLSAAAWAHNGVEHLLGTVTAVTETSVTIETGKHESVTILVDKMTVVTHSDAPALLKDLKKGERVAINAKEGNVKEGQKMMAMTIKWGATAKPAADHPHQK